MTLIESFFIEIMISYGWTITHEYSTDTPITDWWKAQLDEKTKVSHFNLTGLFEAWMVQPMVLAKHFGIDTVNPPKPEAPGILERLPVDGV